MWGGRDHTHLPCPLSPRRLADNLPAATVFRNLKTSELQYEDGFKLGFVHKGAVVVNNHLSINIKYHRVTRLDTPSHHHTLTPSHPHTLTPSYPHSITPSHPHILTPSYPHPHTITPSYQHTTTPSHLLTTLHTYTITPSLLRALHNSSHMHTHTHPLSPSPPSSQAIWYLLPHRGV